MISLSGCAARMDKRGKPLDPNDLKQIKLLHHTQADVFRLLGSPTLIDKFDPTTWFYVYRLTSTKAFLTPQEKTLKIFAVNFNKSGIVKGVKRFGEKGTRSIPIVERQTPTKGKNVSYLEQIFGNFGRIHRGNAPIE